MAKGNEIVVSADARGNREDFYISGTPKPGTVMQIKAATEPVGGRHTVQVFNRDADGNRPQGPLWVLEADYKYGKTASDAYADGDFGKCYCPLPGDDLNMLVSAAGTGTGDSLAIGDLLIVDDGTGLLVKTTGTPETESFMVMETTADVESGGTLTWVKYTGY